MLATGFAIEVDRLTTAPGPAPRLRTVSSATLEQAGYTLAPAVVPPYCGAVQAASFQGWVSGDAAGCQMSRERAEAAAFPGGGRTVIETLLAGVSAGVLGQNHPAWLVVVRYSSLLMPMYLCPVPAIGAACPNVAPGFAATDVIFVDAHTGQQLAVLRVSSNGPLAPTPPSPPGR